MPKNTGPGTPGQEYDQWTLLSLLAVITSRAGHTFSWYTSKKGRVWVTMKGFRPIQYSTSVELLPEWSDPQTFDALKVLYATHFPKLLQEAPPLPTWLPSRDVSKHLDAAIEYVNGIAERWNAGDMFWVDVLPENGQDAKIMDPDDL